MFLLVSSCIFAKHVIRSAFSDDNFTFGCDQWPLCFHIRVFSLGKVGYIGTSGFLMEG